MAFVLDDFLIAAAIAAATAGGSAMLNNAAAKKVAKQQKIFTDMEQQKQDSLREKARQNFGQLLGNQQKSSQDEDLAAQTAALGKTYDNGLNASNFQALLPGQGNASDTVKADIVNSGNKALGKSRQRASSRAALDAYSRVGLNNEVKTQDAKNTLGNISNESQGSYKILPTELQGAQSKGNGLRGWANALSTIGSIASSAASGSAFSSAANPAVVNPSNALMSFGDKFVTPGLDLYSTAPVGNMIGPQLTKTSWTSLLNPF